MSARKIIKNEILESYIKSDLKVLGLPVDFKLELRGYSKRYYGRYYVNQKKISVFILDENGYEIPYHEILDTVLHEAIHHYQHQHDKDFVRVHGVMHDPNFKMMYDHYRKQLEKWEVLPSA